MSKYVYYCDPMGNAEEEVKYLNEYYNDKGYDLKIEPLDGGPAGTYRHWQDVYFDVCFFDYGGLLPGCDTLIEQNYNDVIEYAKEHPSKLFVMVTSFTADMMRRELEGMDLPANILFEKADLIGYLQG